jgi:hypothetical protein
MDPAPTSSSGAPANLILLLRTLEAEVRLYPGRVLSARVVDNSDPARAKLSIAGKLLEAQLPDHLQEGQEVRLTVHELSSERVVLSLSTPAELLAGAAAVPVPIAPERYDALSEEEQSEQERQEAGRGAAVSLRYEAPSIGAVDMRLEVRDGTLHALLALRAGEPHTLAREESAKLREGLSASTGLPVELVIQARHDPIELYA